MRTKIYLTPADHGRPLSWREFESRGFSGGLPL